MLMDARDLLAPDRKDHRVGRGFQVDARRLSAARQAYERDYVLVTPIEDALELPAQVRK
jgi:hypothetical protein